MLGATQKQLYKMDDSGNITGFQPYKAYGGTYDAQGNQISYDPSKAVAGFSPLQQQAQQGIANLQLPSTFGQGANMAGMAGMGALDTTGQAGMYGGMGARAGQQAAGLSNMYGGAGVQAGQQAAGMSNMYGGLGAMSGQQYANQSAGAGQQGANIGQQYGGQSAMYGGMGAMQGQQGAQIGQSLGQMSQDPNAVQGYMNPYLQASLNPQLAEVQRQYDITGQGEQSAAARAGAFGGSREALMAAENQRNKNMAMNQVIGQGYNQAFTNAQQQMNAANQAALSGNAQALQGYGMGLQGVGQAGQLGMQGTGQALQGYGQAGSQALAGYGMGLQGAGQAGQQAMQGYGMGLQGAGQAGQMGMQGAGMGLQGVGAQQAGYGQLGQAGASLANIGNQALAAQQGIYGAQNQIGAQQQANQQQVINQAMQDYANAQQYPIMQLGTMSNMLRGLPMQAQTTQQYQAQANPITQGIGALGAGASLYNATKAEGGVVKAAKGGIMSYDVGGEVYSNLLEMEPEQLTRYIKESSSPRVKSMAEQVLREKTGKASGGIMRYADGDETKSKPSNTDLMFQKIQAQKDADLAPYNKMVAEENARLAARSPAPVARPELVNQAYADAAKLNAFNMPTSTSVSKNKVEDIDKMNLGIKNVNASKTSTASLSPELIEQEKRLDSAPPVKIDARALNNLYGPTQSKVSNETTVKPVVSTNQNASTNVKTPVVPVNQNPNAITAAKPVVPTATANAQPVKDAAQDLEKPPVLEQDKRTLADYIKEIRDQTPANLGNQEARAKAMAERANAADEAKRATNMRMAEFFASWGSTPGNTIVAGLNALKNKIPDMINDTKEANKIRREIDKDIAALDRIDREEELGTIKDARTAKEKVASNAQLKYGHELTAYASLTSSRRQAESAKYEADQRLKGQQMIAASNISKGSGNSTKEDSRNYNSALKGRQAEEKLFDAKLKDDYVYGPSKTYLSNPENQKKDPKRWKAAEDYVNKINKEKQEALAPYDEDINYYKGRLGRDVPTTPTQNATQTPIYATNGKDRIVSNDGGKTWQPVGGK
jgi:hypothetical protein